MLEDTRGRVHRFDDETHARIHVMTTVAACDTSQVMVSQLWSKCIEEGSTGLGQLIPSQGV